MHRSLVGSFKPGDEIPRSGIYRVTHAGHHYDHEVTCLSGQPFPLCHQCGDRVRFTLIIGAHDIRRHVHFYPQPLQAVEHVR